MIEIFKTHSRKVTCHFRLNLICIYLYRHKCNMSSHVKSFINKPEEPGYNISVLISIRLLRYVSCSLTTNWSQFSVTNYMPHIVQTPKIVGARTWGLDSEASTVTPSYASETYKWRSGGMYSKLMSVIQ